MTIALRSQAAAFLGLAQMYVDAPWLPPALAELDARMAQDGGHDYGHLLRVLANAARIVEEERRTSGGPGPAWEAIAAAVLFHDVVNLPKNHPERHLASVRSAEVAARVLRQTEGFPSALVPLVEEAIAAHSFSAGLVAQSLEARIVCDADRLESIGAFAIARTFYVSGALGRSICHMEDPFAKDRPLDDREYGVDHFYAKLLRLKEQLYTRAARQLAESRHALMLRFLDGLREELGVGAPARPNAQSV